MTTNGVNFQKAVDYCVLNGATVQESAAKFGVDMAQLSEFITKAMNPNGGGEVGDFAQFSNHIANKEIAHAQVKIGTKEYTVSVVGAKGEQGASAKIYDKDGKIVPFSQFDKDYSFTVGDDGRINMKLKPGSKAPIAKVTQETDGNGNWFDTFANFWRKGNKNAVEGKAYEVGSAVADDVVIVANRTNAAPTGAPNGVDNGVATKTMDDVYAQYALDKPQADKAEDAVKNAFANLSPEDKKKAMELATSAMEKAEAGDIEGAQKDASELDKFMGNVFGGLGLIDLPEEAKVALLVVGIAGLAYAAAEAGVVAVTSKVAQRAAAVFAAMGLTSCSDNPLDDSKTTIIDNSSVKATVAANVTTKIDNSALAEAYNKGIQDMINFLKPYMDQLTQNQNTITDFVAQILAKLNTQGVKLDNIEELINKFITEYGIDAKNKDELLTKIYTAITSADQKTQDALKNINYLLSVHNEKADETNALLTKLISLVNKLGKDGNDFGNKIIQMLSKLNLSVTASMDKLLDAVNNGNIKLDDIKVLLQKLDDDGNKNTKDILNYLGAIGFEMNGNFSKLIEAVKDNKISLDEIKNMLAQLNALVNDNNAQNKELGNKILDALGKLGFDISANFTAVLEAINKGVAGADSLRDLLEKVLEKQDKNTKAIIEAIGNIKVGSGGTVDLSSIKKMLAELLKQSQKNGNILSNIDAKTDVIATTTKSILEALNKEFGKNDERYKNINNLLTVIANKNNGNGNDKVLLEKLDKILQKLDEIKDAIKNHKVEVDVTGKVTCECNCGSKHEGILGDLNDLLG